MFSCSSDTEISVGHGTEAVILEYFGCLLKTHFTRHGESEWIKEGPGNVYFYQSVLQLIPISK
jgi:hypothetical protein